MPSAKKVLRKFLTAIQRAPAGSLYEVGLTWDKDNGWRVYQRIADTRLAMDAKMARQFAAIFDKLGAQPEWQHVRHGLEETLGALRPLADEADQNNRNKIVPEGAAEFMPAQGFA